MSFLPDVLNLNLFETMAAFLLENRGSGTYVKRMEIQGNSILSSVFIKSMAPGSTIEVKYWDTTIGQDAGERFDLDSHRVITDSDTFPLTNRIEVTRIHNKPRLEVIVTGTVEFGVYITVVSSFANDLDNALILEGDTFVQERSKAVPMACLDSVSGLLHFLRCKDGQISVTDDLGDPFFLEGKETIDPGNPKTILSFTTPSDTIRRLKRFYARSGATGTFLVYAGGTLIADRSTHPGEPNVSFKWDPIRPIPPSTLVTLRFRALSSAPPAASASGQIMASDILNV